MIKFFRKIRQNLLIENKTGKYFKYAIGEILLVMVGILLALQVSNWNQQHNQLNQEHKILHSLKTDFLESKERLLKTMFMQKNVVRKSSNLIKMYEGKIPRSINDSIINYLNYGAYSWYRSELLTGAYDAFINSGNSELIRNEQLTKLLAEYFSIVKSGFEDQENSMNLLNNMQNILAPVDVNLRLRKNGPRIGLDTLRSPNEDIAIDFLFKQDAFFGNLLNKTKVEKLRYDIQKEMLNHITQILSILNQEIELHE
ncbi:MAG: hypothetical protein ACI9AT_000831 [Ulvibacter sp.]|jgi:hypothetical protein